ncbi:MAG: hypothetical protein JSS49_03910 [Planctomycetes bacterium]|nr:hypothetical protein [Planctomycetota bacterium]
MSSPFARGKYEESTKHTYFLPHHISQLENARPTVLFGSRGSGKTTLLRSLDWQERFENPTLRHQLGNDPFRGRFIGVYTKLSGHACKSVDFLHASQTPLEGMIFGFYLDLLSIELIAAAVSGLISDGILTGQTGRMEQSVADHFVSNWGDLLEWSNLPPCRTVLDVGEASSQIRKKIERSAQQSIDPKELADQIRIPAFGEFAKSVSVQLGEACNSCGFGTNGTENSWHFKICLDEAEVLSDRQQLVVNTLIRMASNPLFPVVSYVSRPTDLSQTLIPRLTLQKADLQQISLDDQTLSGFAELAEGVATVRCQQELDDESVRFTLNASLGKLNLNRLVGDLLRNSENPAASELQLLAEKFSVEWGIGDDEEESPPYYEAFIADRLKLSPPNPSEFKSKRRQESAEFRKKMVVAYLAICKHLLKRNVRFAFAEMVLGVSDGCIRDFLSQLHQIFIEKFPSASRTDLRQFLCTSVSPTDQDKAIRRASEQKRDSIPRSGVLRPVQVGRLIRGLAEVTAMLQNRIPTEHRGGFIEYGIFQLRGGTQNERREATRLVRDAAEAGFLRLTGADDHADPLEGFRVHSSLAPAFGFSYRGAYYSTPLDIATFHQILQSRDDSELAEIAKRLASGRSQQDDPQRLLFPVEEEIEGSEP